MFYYGICLAPPTPQSQDTRERGECGLHRGQGLVDHLTENTVACKCLLTSFSGEANPQNLPVTIKGSQYVGEAGVGVEQEVNVQFNDLLPLFLFIDEVKR